MRQTSGRLDTYLFEFVKFGKETTRSVLLLCKNFTEYTTERNTN